MLELSDFTKISLFHFFFWGIPLVMLFLWLAGELNRITCELRVKKIKSKHVGKQTAQDLFALAHLHHIRVLTTESRYSDYYDTEDKAIYLSEETAADPTLAATGIVAHEVGHALQDKENFWLIRKSEIILRVNNLAGNATLPILIAGFLLDIIEVLLVGWALFIISTVCNILLFCLHSNATKRGEGWLRRDKFVSKEEEKQIEKFLHIANLTYLGGIFTSPLQICFTIGNAVANLSHRK